MGQAKPEMIRLDKLLANLGYGSRKDVPKLVKRGLVTLHGEPITDPELKLPLQPELESELMIEGEPLDPLPGLTLLMNKPLGVSCSHKEHGDVVYELLPERWRAREPALTTVGRLDKETSGLLLLTDDGALVHKITSPKAAIPKRYLVTLARPLEGGEKEALASGTLMLNGEKEPLLPAGLEIHSPTSVTISITEGRYHQVRRMFAALGNHVEALHRLSVGRLELPADLEPGAYLRLPPDTLAAVFLPPNDRA
jgi:16S rRNA pseudouridine516 synthase